MDKGVSFVSGRQLIAEVSGQGHAMAGAVIALSAAQAAALGHACLQISLGEGIPSWYAPEVPSVRMGEIITELLDWCDRDATAIAAFVSLREVGEPLAGQELLCAAPAQVCRLGVQAVKTLEDFRPFVHERIRDDLEISIRLLVGAAQAALLLLDSNLRIWPEPVLLMQFEPILEQLQEEIDQLRPLNRIR